MVCFAIVFNLERSCAMIIAVAWIATVSLPLASRSSHREILYLRGLFQVKGLLNFQARGLVALAFSVSDMDKTARPNSFKNYFAGTVDRVFRVIGPTKCVGPYRYFDGVSVVFHVCSVPRREGASFLPPLEPVCALANQAV